MRKNLSRWIVMLLIGVMTSKVSASEGPLEPGYIPFQGEVKLNSAQYNYSSTHSYQASQAATQSCLTQLRLQEGGGNRDAESAIKMNARRQTRTGVIVGTSAGVVAGVGAGLLTANPIVGAGVGGVYFLQTAIGTALERSAIKKNGNTLSAAEKIVTGREAELSKNERKAFEKTRKKVSKKVYRDKELLDNRDFAHTVVSQNSTSEKLFCDEDKNGNIRILAQNRKTINRLKLAQQCKDTQRYVVRK